MNGRVYDATLGRFISADPNIDGVSDAQGYNRYSYVGNNPLGSTDPTGFFSLKDILPALIAIVVTVVVTVCTYGAGTEGDLSFWGSFFGASSEAVTGISYGVWTPGLTAIAAGGAAGGFAGGFSGSLLNGGSLGDAFRAGVIGGICGGVTAIASAGVGAEFGAVGNDPINEFERATAHGLVGGGIESASGGQFRHGFYSSFAGSVAGSIAPRLGMGENGDGEASHIAVRTTFSAVVGGTTSVLGGGKFANGAITAAFQHLFNDEHGRPKAQLVLQEKLAGQTITDSWKSPTHYHMALDGIMAINAELGADLVSLASFEDGDSDMVHFLITSAPQGTLTVTVSHGGGGYFAGIDESEFKASLTKEELALYECVSCKSFAEKTNLYEGLNKIRAFYGLPPWGGYSWKTDPGEFSLRKAK